MLLLMLMSPTLTRLMPSRVLSWVSEIERLLALLTPWVKVNCCSWLSVCHVMDPTETRDGKLRVDMMVNDFRLKSFPMELKVLADKEVRLEAPLHVKLPAIDVRPVRSIAPAAVEATTKEPVRAVHDEARAVASAWEATVAVA